MAIEAVVFDIGNVLIEWNPERFYDATIGRARREAMFAAVDLHAMNDAVDRGADWAQTVRATQDAYPAFAAEIGMWHSHWHEMASPAIPQTVRLMAALKARGVPVFALSNIGDETYARGCALYDFLGGFDRPYISGRMRMAKPDAAIYAAVEADCGLAPGALLFTDDRAENIAAAAARGWQTHLFAGAAGLAARLIAERLLDESEAA